MAQKKIAAKAKSSPEAAQPQLSFEQSLEALEQIVRQLEDGGLELDASLAKYEQGMKHLKACYAALRSAERRIELLAGVDADGRPVREPFDHGDLTVEQKREQRSARRSHSDPMASRRDQGGSEDIDEPQGLF